MLLTTGSSVKDANGNIYILDDVLGGGGFGNVFKAHRQSDGFVVAVKTLLSSFASPDVLLAFQKELQCTSVVSSDNVIKYYFTHDGTMYPAYPPYIIMEYIDGGTLNKLLQTQAATGKLFELSFITNACMQLAEGMNAISKTLVHRDIKPDNILVHNETLKITDFGLSKYAADSTRTLTLKGYGTLDYVAPEAWESEKNTIQMDIYSMGIVFYQIATLQYPYKLPTVPDANAYRDAHLYQRVQNPITHNPNLPQGLVSIILRMIEKPTQKRFSNWEEIIEALAKNTAPTSTSNTALERALANRNNADLKKQEEAATRKKAEILREQQCKLVFSQYEAVLYEPIRAFISAFNEQYAGTTGFHFEDKHHNSLSDHFAVKISTPDKKWICIDTEVVLAENHHRPTNTFYCCHDLTRQYGWGRRRKAACSHDFGDNTLDDIHECYHEFQAVGDHSLCQHKANKDFDRYLRSLQFSNASAGFHDTNQKEQHQKGEAYGLQCAVDIQNNGPQSAAFEIYGTLGQ